ncbi:restriction endonuclease subunit S [Pantoea sp. EA-12]|uniref:restriction endonuclease subunit S n=1 Tax=Pantoea sp. EA-12 TaxID=3043303 RepID=UPI0024B60685|nr:restriction endonuclease subunit S [Pantoea sp. EA-12]MDI9222671.1 restriction endonuclease subunit S [Pantoea sp. EA-12]
MRFNLTYSLNEIAEIYDGPHATPKKLEKGNAIFLSISSIENGRLNLEKSSFISDDDFAKWTRRVTPQAGDVVFSYETKIGEASIIPEGLRCCLGRRMGLLRAKQNKVLPQYLLYAYLSPAFQDVIREKTIHGSTTDRLSIKEMPSFKIEIPDIHSQKKIIKILSAIDIKLSKNTEINQTLEQMAQALFKSWFVDFEPVKAKIAVLEVGGSQEDATFAAMTAISGKNADALAVFEREYPEQYAELKATAELFPSAMQESELGAIPEGWLVKPLGDSLEIKRGGSPRPINDFIRPTGYPWVKIADATASISPFLFKTSQFIKEEGLKKTVYLRKGELILSNSATPGLPKFLQLDACIHDGWLYFPRISNYTDTYLYFLFLKIRRELVAKGNGSVFTNLKTDILREHLAVLPECKIVNRFSVLALSYLDAIKANELTINSLSCIRDTLLPKLLSGEITLPDAEQAVSEAENV